MAKVAIVMGSGSDLPAVRDAYDIIKSFSVCVEMRIMSAHRTPKLVADFSCNAEKEGFSVIIAAAGKAAHLAGVIAGHTVLPVIGLPIKSSTMDGLDSLLSTVQMPSGVPVATVAINGAVNAGLLAIEILAVGDDELRKKLHVYKADMAKKIESADAALQAELNK